MNITRRNFFIGGAAFGALAGCRGFFAAGEPSSSARLTLGVISDIHIDCGAGDFKKFGDTALFERTLRWFDAQGADGVVLAGDMADNGMVNQLQCVAEAWFRVFPNGRSARDGRRVEQLFIYGNHDFEGQNYDKFGIRYVEPDSFKAAQIVRNPKRVWQDLFHEDYAPIWRKTVKGYSFIGAHWKSWNGDPAIEPYFAENGKSLDPSLPFFFIQHPHPQGTVYAGRCWGADKGYATRALSPFPNAVAFTGHSHGSLTDELSIWQGAFTSIGTSSLRYGGEANKWEQRQGMLVRVHADRLVITRRDFEHDLSLGADWVVPLPTAEKRPFETAVRRRASVPPRFSAADRLVVEQVEKGWLVTIPCANAGATRAFQYEIQTGLTRKDGTPGVFTIFDAKYNMPRSMAGAPTQYLVKSADFPADAAPKFAVAPLDCFGNHGNLLKA
ncbi:MAG: metallophosphoesterase [Kiritimatiellia bacterium]